MVECEFELDCANANTWKCQFCRSICTWHYKESALKKQPDLPKQTINYRFFKDKLYYAKTLPIIPNLKLFFEV